MFAWSLQFHKTLLRELRWPTASCELVILMNDLLICMQLFLVVEVCLGPVSTTAILLFLVVG